MQLCFFYAVISAVFIGLYKFLNKIIAEKKVDKQNYILYTSIAQLIITFFYFLYTKETFYMTLLFAFLIIARTILVTEKVLATIESLKYIDSSLFFPANKLIQMLWGFLVWLFFFWEHLEKNEIIFIFVWIISVILLWYKKWELQNKDLKKWIIFLLLASLFLVGTSTINKYIWENESISIYMMLCSFASIIYILFKIKIQKHKILFRKKEIFYGFISWLIWIFWFFFHLNALAQWKLVIVQLISSIATFIPILLSYIFLKEHINKYRIFWLILFLINLWVFYIGKYWI